MLDSKTWDKLKKIDIEDAHKYMDSDSSSGEENVNEVGKVKPEQREEVVDDSSSDDPHDTVARIDRMA